MDHTNLTYKDVESLTQHILRQMHKDSWQPDYVVGLTRGGLLPAVLISQYFDCPMETLKIKLRDHPFTESNTKLINDSAEGKNILIIDDINDTGATLNWIKQDWSNDNEYEWNRIWGNNVRTAVLIDNLSSKCILDINYCGMEINKEEDPRWVNFPYENWWTK